MPEFTGLFAYRGNPLTLVGDQVDVGDEAPDVTLLATDFSPRRLSAARGKVVVLSVAPSVDTSVCAMQLRMFNQRAAGLGDDVLVWNVSRDLPFALKRFCAAEGIENAEALSDYKDRELGERFGLHIKETALLARSVWVIGRDGRVVYKQIVPELSSEPDYAPAIEAAQAAL
jgi:thioredoxin-dependent peroxiredoxin